MKKSFLILIILLFNSLTFPYNLNEELISAVMEGNLNKVSSLIKKGANVNYIKKQHELYTTPLIAAITSGPKGYIDIVDLLLKNNADINLATPDGWNPLICASYWGRVEIVKLLLKRKPNLHQKTAEGYTALSLAREQGYKEIVKLLLKAGAKE